MESLELPDLNSPCTIRFEYDSDNEKYFRTSLCNTSTNADGDQKEVSMEEFFDEFKRLYGRPLPFETGENRMLTKYRDWFNAKQQCSISGGKKKRTRCRNKKS